MKDTAEDLAGNIGNATSELEDLLQEARAAFESENAPNPMTEFYRNELFADYASVSIFDADVSAAWTITGDGDMSDPALQIIYERKMEGQPPEKYEMYISAPNAAMLATIFSGFVEAQRKEAK